jgi:hypothetical protein
LNFYFFSDIFFEFFLNFHLVVGRFKAIFSGLLDCWIGKAISCGLFELF